MAVEAKKAQITRDAQLVKGWLAERMKDPDWVAETKALSDKADAHMRAKGLLPQK